MGQYWLAVNMDKHEFVDPHKLGCGLKLWEQLANHPGTGAALVILCAAMPEVRGGGDLDLDENWHGPERTFPDHNATPGPMQDSYPEIAHGTIGRWAGDRIALVGDYAGDSDLPAELEASTIYDRCVCLKDFDGVDEDGDSEYHHHAHHVREGPLYKDITEMVCRVIEHELGGAFEKQKWGGAYWRPRGGR